MRKSIYTATYPIFLTFHSIFPYVSHETPKVSEDFNPTMGVPSLFSTKRWGNECLWLPVKLWLWHGSAPWQFTWKKSWYSNGWMCISPFVYHIPKKTQVLTHHTGVVDVHFLPFSGKVGFDPSKHRGFFDTSGRPVQVESSECEAGNLEY